MTLRDLVLPRSRTTQDLGILGVTASEGGGPEVRARMLMWGADQTAVPTPFGTPVDVLNAAPHGMSVDLALAALHPVM